MNNKNIQNNNNKTNINGRVNILSESNVSNSMFNLYDRIPVNQKASAYTEALTGNYQDSVLSTAFFSAQNIQAIQNGIRSKVYERTNRLISQQNEDIVKIIMRSVFLQFSANLDRYTKEQIRELNKKVIDISSRRVLEELLGYLNYQRDASTMYTPMEHPIAFSTKGDKVVEYNPGFGN